ncbi:MAG: hypothetical protein PHV51_02305 [Methanosarcinaceae archaeon]|nr:hypothetical protein [Methanosarcinaceae archaeon]MDD4496977.1 hypothetical protein [Methanosarcinaceae archaeon]
MAKEVIVSAILMIASVIAAVTFVNAIIPSVYELSQSYNSVARNMEDQFKTDIEIIFVYPHDETGNDTVSLWIKNVGSSEIPFENLIYSNIFLSSSSQYCNPDFESASPPSWNYTSVDKTDNIWGRGETIELTITPGFELSGKYQISFYLYNGISVSDTFSK